MAIKNQAASVLARLKNQAQKEGIHNQMALQLFMQEEFLRRLAMSKYKENFVLKGGMFIYILTEFKSRPIFSEGLKAKICHKRDKYQCYRVIKNLGG